MNLLFVGAGKMNSALIHGLLEAGICRPEQIAVVTRTAGKAARLASELGIRVPEFPEEEAASADAVILGVKPADAPAALSPFRSRLADRFLISVVAGLKLGTLADQAPAARIARAMPNTPLQCGAGMTVLAFSEAVTESERARAEAIFGSCGQTAVAPESALDAVTALSGSGPAYFFLMMEALEDAGVTAGLPRELSRRLSVQTAYGAGRLAVESDASPAQLREGVMSPGGTTAAALRVFETGALRGTVLEAVAAARQRAEELDRLA